MANISGRDYYCDENLNFSYKLVLMSLFICYSLVDLLLSHFLSLYSERMICMFFNEDIYAPTPEITPLTMALLTEEDAAGNLVTYVMEELNDYTVSVPASKVMDHACKFFGSSLKGRQDGTRDICGITHKAPISVDPLSGMYFFPTTSPSSKQCSWIAHSHIDHILDAAGQGTEIMFKNGKKVNLSVSYGSMLNQVQRTAQFRYLLDNRIRFLQKQVSEKAAETFA